MNNKIRDKIYNKIDSVDDAILCNLMFNSIWISVGFSIRCQLEEDFKGIKIRDQLREDLEELK